LAPPTIATTGRFGLPSAGVQRLELGLHQPPGIGGQQMATPSVEAWARCAAEKASLT
jgi:hypothetical protein